VEGTVDYSAPQVRDTPQPFVSRVRAALSERTQEPERLAVELLRARIVDARHRGRLYCEGENRHGEPRLQLERLVFLLTRTNQPETVSPDWRGHRTAGMGRRS